MQFKGQYMRAVVLQGAAPQTVLGITPKAMAGLKPTDVSVIGVDAGNGAVAAMRAGQIDAIKNLAPVITLLQWSGDLTIVSDTRMPGLIDGRWLALAIAFWRPKAASTSTP